MKAPDLVPALVGAGRTEGCAFAYREAAKALRQQADQFDVAAKQAEEQAAVQRKAADALLTKVGGSGELAARRLVRAGRAAWRILRAGT